MVRSGQIARGYRIMKVGAESQHATRLRRCCQLEVLQDHYSRFGADVRTGGMMHFKQLMMQHLGKVQFFWRCNLDLKDLERS